VEATLTDIKKCLDSSNIPDYGAECDFCKYQKQILNIK